MSNKIKVHISLNEAIYNEGKIMAEKMGIPFSTYISILISNNSNEKTKGKQNGKLINM